MNPVHTSIVRPARTECRPIGITTPDVGVNSVRPSDEPRQRGSRETMIAYQGERPTSAAYRKGRPLGGQSRDSFNRHHIRRPLRRMTGKRPKQYPDVQNRRPGPIHPLMTLGRSACGQVFAAPPKAMLDDSCPRPFYMPGPEVQTLWTTY